MTSVYLLASERSGTNLLRREITAHQERYFGMSPAHLLKHLYYNEPYYGDLDQDDNFKCLIQDAIDLCLIHFSPWDIELKADVILEEYGSKERNSIYLSDFLMKKYARSKGYEGYFCKDNFIHEFALDIATKLPDAKFIYLYRDPRDVVSSQKKRPNGNISAFYFAKMWDYEQVKCIRTAYELSKSGRCYQLSYEGFLSDAEKHIEKICAFLNVEKQEIRRERQDKIVDEVPEWKNLDAPIIRNNKNKFLDELSKNEIRKIELTCDKTMAYLGYSKVVENPKALSYAERLGDKIYAFLYKVYFKVRYRKQPTSLKKRAIISKKLHMNYCNRG